jgi:hypothetical protein
MVSKEAEERRLRFLAAKEAAGGNFASLMKQELSKKPKVYFLEDGTIISITKDDIEAKDGWLCKEFDNEQVQILEDKNWNLFYVKKDPLVDNLYSIESRPLESTIISSENNSLIHVDYSDKISECSCTLTKNKFTIELSKSVLDKYSEIDPAAATANGQKVLKFYFTAPNDPHVMLHSEYISLRQLISQTKVSISMKNSFTDCSIYTVKAFASYTRTSL